MKRYNPSEIEPKWQEIWAKNASFKAVDFDGTRPKMYLAEMFPYPSAAGLHLGHVRNFTIVDVLSRFYAQQGFNVLRPFGYDTFGLPAENYAIAHGVSPQKATEDNIANFRKQAESLGFAIDWSREISSSEPEYYKWTQWIFTQLYKKGLAYKKESFQWWCDFDKTVLANEQVEGGKCWRCGHEVEKRKMSQWYFKITAYADELLNGLDALDWPEKIKVMQCNWIGRSVGAEVNFKVENQKNIIKVFTTRPDTLFGATFMVLAPEHPLISKITTKEQSVTVDKYRSEAMRKSEIERQENKEKTGVFTGSYAINPVNAARIPIWIADYVLPDYGEGAIMAVPAHDERDFEFAKKFNIPIEQVIAPNFGEAHASETQVSGTVVIGYDPKENKFLSLETKVGNSRYRLPSGGLDDGETFEQCAKREFFEETGYHSEKFTQLGGLIMSHYFNSIKKSYRSSISAAFIAVIDDVNQVDAGGREKHEQDFTNAWLDFDTLYQEIAKTRPDNDHWLYILEMAKRFVDNNLKPVPSDTVFTDDGVLINSDYLNGLNVEEAKKKIIKELKKTKAGNEKVQYKMRDWLISRQRYWGCPIPVAYDKNGREHLISDDQLPVLLPEVKDYKPDDSGHSALAKVKDWLKVELNGEEMTRETDTLDGYACSSWYLLRYCDPHNSEQAWDKKLIDFWNPIDVYVGADHAVAHLLYVRFWCKAFADLGLVDFREPVKKLIYHGYINGEDNKKMSKSKGNTIDPLDIINSGYGADTLRTYEMFIAPYDMDAPWSTAGVGGVYRFLTRVWNLAQDYLENPKDVSSSEITKLQHKTIKKVTEDLTRQGFNTAVAALMEYLNGLTKLGVNREALTVLLKLLAPFAPHLASELLTTLDEEKIDWPQYNEKLVVDGTVKIGVQVNGKLRGEIEVTADTDETTAVELAKTQENVANYLSQKDLKKIIYVPGKILNIIV